MKLLARTTLCLALGLSLQGAKASEIGIHFIDGGLFMAPSCNTNIAIAKFKERVVRNGPGVSSDDHLPWPDLYGYWFDTSRDLVIRVEYSEGPMMPYGMVSVRFYSLCNGTVIARGSHILQSYDWKAGHMSVSMDMGRTFPGRLEVTLSLNGLQQRDRMNVKVSDPGTGQQCQVLDQFKARRL